jgi:hypothetical protein
MSIDDIKKITNEQERHIAIAAMMAPMTLIEKLDVAIKLAEELEAFLINWGLRMEAKAA